jgi:thiol-disulfide isomerase/thioredoxin
MNINLQGIREKTVSISQYMETLTDPFKDKFLTRKQTYQLKTEVINQLKKFANKYIIVAFSAEWCKDCASHIPVLALISRATGVEVRVFGGLKKDPLNTDRKWRIPPSPPEVEAFDVDKIPLILLYNNEGEQIGRITENPEEPTLEEELLKILKKWQ